jgi:hypothetical protein
MDLNHEFGKSQPYRLEVDHCITAIRNGKYSVDEMQTHFDKSAESWESWRIQKKKEELRQVAIEMGANIKTDAP